MADPDPTLLAYVTARAARLTARWRAHDGTVIVDAVLFQEALIKELLAIAELHLPMGSSQ